MSKEPRAWSALSGAQHRVGLVALGLGFSLLLPWYQTTTQVLVSGKLQSVTDTVSAFGDFSWVEAAVLLVVGGVLALLISRAGGSTYRMPGGDGFVCAFAGIWCSLLIAWRIFDKPSVEVDVAHSKVVGISSVGVSWGIFVSLLLAVALIYVGARIQAPPRSQKRMHAETAEHPQV